MEEKKKCKYCKSEIAKDAKKCPVCKKGQGMPAWAIILIIIGSILLLGMLVSSGNKTSNNTSSSSSSGQEKNSSDATASQDKVYAVGEEAILSNGSVTVTKVEKSQGTQYDKPKAGKEFVIVHVTIKNKGKSNLSYNPYDFKVQNSQGQQEEQTISLVDQDTQLNSGELAASGSVSGTIVFEEPTSDTGLILIYQDNIWSSRTLKIKL